MPNINDMIQSKYLKIDDIPDPVFVTVQGVKQVNLAKEGEPEQMKWACKFKEYQKPMVLNATNLKNAARIFNSPHTEDWVGKEIILFNDPTVSFEGKETGGLRFRGQDKAPVRVAAKAESENHAPVESLEDDIPW